MIGGTAMLCNNIGVNEAGRLTFAGMDTVDLAKKYKTPLYLMDEDKIRANCRTYRTAMEKWLRVRLYQVILLLL